MDNKKNNIEEESKEQSSPEEQTQTNSFWKKLGSAVKKAVDCCLE